jgi:hypothetical protein
MDNEQRYYQTEDIQVHFGDTPLASSKPKKSQKPSCANNATFHVWSTHSDSPPDNLMDEEIPPSPKILSRATIFEVNSAQPRYPPYIFTRSDAETLKFNIGRIIPVFRHITTDWGRRFVSDGGGRRCYHEHFASAYCVYVEGDKDEDRGGGGGCCACFDRIVDGRIFGLGDEPHVFYYYYY